MTPAALLKAVTGQHLQVSFRSGPYRVTIYDRPGHYLPKDSQDKIRAELVDITRKVEPRGDLDYGVFLDDPEIWKALSLTVVHDAKSGELAGFNAMRWIQTHPDEMPLLHLGLVQIDPERQSQGISWILYGLTIILLFLRGGLKPLKISSVTQVPAVFGRVATSFADVYPDGSTPSPAYRHLREARAIMATHRHVFGVGDDAWFEEDSFVIRNSYTGGSDAMKKPFEAASKHRDDTVNAFCQTTLDYERGDDFLQIGQIDLPTVRAYFLREVPAGSRTSVLMVGAFAVLQNWIAPVVAWLDVKRTWRGLATRGAKQDV